MTVEKLVSDIGLSDDFLKHYAIPKMNEIVIDLCNQFRYLNIWFGREYIIENFECGRKLNQLAPQLQEFYKTRFPKTFNKAVKTWLRSQENYIKFLGMIEKMDDTAKQVYEAMADIYALNINKEVK